MTGHIICGKPAPKSRYQYKKTVDTMTDTEIRHKLCKGIHCPKCESFEFCRYGKEAVRRELV